jgi:hypothetical protein
MDKTNVVQAATKRERWQRESFSKLTMKGSRKMAIVYPEIRIEKEVYVLRACFER